MRYSARNVSRALAWGLANRQWWLLSWWLRGKLRGVSLALDRLRRDGRSRPPYGITARLTMRCNLRCRMCHVVHSHDETVERLRERGDMPLEMAYRLIDDVAGRGTYICFSGGEPLLYHDLPAVLSRARDRRVMATMATNGQLLEERAEELVASGLKVLSVSVLGPPDVHNETVGVPDAFERLGSGVEAVERARRKLGSRTPVTVLNCPMTDLNVTRLAEIADVAADWPIAALHYQHMWFKPAEALALQRSAHRGLLEDDAFAAMGEADESAIDADALADQIDDLYCHPGRHPIAVFPPLSRAEVRRYYTDPLAPIGPPKAVCLWLFTFVHPNGEVSPCEGFNAGNLNDQSFMEIWNGERLREFRRTLLRSGTLPVCRRCCVFHRRY
jgi:MoaA/NifB/PqqE/SkfB family radical SAM enzyme